MLGSLLARLLATVRKPTVHCNQFFVKKKPRLSELAGTCIWAANHRGFGFRRRLSPNNRLRSVGSAWDPRVTVAVAYFSYRGIWNGRYYETKQVHTVFVQEADEIVVITVYTYYFTDPKESPT